MFSKRPRQGGNVNSDGGIEPEAELASEDAEDLAPPSETAAFGPRVLSIIGVVGA
jgi:hypothetical protein